MYDWDKIHEQAIEIIEEKLIRKITYLIAELPCSERQFYEYMEREPQKAQEIREKLNEAKIKRKAKMIERWEESGNPTLEIAAFKLMADEEELEAITISKVKQENKLTFENLPKVTLTDAGSQGTEDQDI